MGSNLQDTSQTDLKAKTAARYAWIILGAGIASFTGDWITVQQSHLWQMNVMAGFSLVLAILAAFALLASWRKHPNLAAILLAISGVILSLGSSFLIDGMGIASGVASILVTAVIATQVASQQYRRILTLTGIVSGVVAILIQLFFRIPWRISIVSPLVMGVIIAASILTMLVYIIFQYNTFPLRTKLLVGFLGTSLTAIITVALVTNFTTRQALTNSVSDRLKNISDAQALAVGDYFSRYVGLIKVLAINPTILDETLAANEVYPTDTAETTRQILTLNKQWITSKEANNSDDPLVQSRLNNPSAAILKEFQKLYPEFADVSITDNYGALVASSTFTPDYNQGDEPWFVGARNLNPRNAYISTPEYYGASKTILIDISAPIFNPSTNQYTGVIHNTLNIQSLVDILLKEAGTTVNTVVIFPERFLKIANEESLDFVDFKLVSAFDKIINKPVVEMSFFGTTNLVSVSSVRTNTGNSYIDRLGLLVVTYQPSDQAIAPVQAQTNLIAIMAVLISLVVVIIAIIIGSFITRPILRLTEVAGKVLAGDLTAQTDIKSKDEIGKLSLTFDSMTSRLRETLSGLEQRITERTRAIEASALVGRRLTTILDQSQLVRAVVDQLQQAFNYYHVQIYLYDQARENLVMAGGTGEPGRTMLERGHKIQHGAGLVGRASEIGTVVLVSDTTTEPNWLPNPLLPETKSEIVVPILIGDEVLGALDVQQNMVNGLTQQDSDLLQLIASQVAVALRNSRLYAEAQRQVEREALVNSIVQQIQQTNSVDEALQIAVRELGRALKVPRTSVRLRMSSTNDGKS